MKIMKVKISDIKINPGRRTAVENDIEELAFSISEIGLLNPITLTEDHTLIAGLHRLEAVKLSNWPTYLVMILSGKNAGGNEDHEG